MPPSQARERVLNAAEALFSRRGYEAVTVKDIAKAADIHHSSIYHHLPADGGKEALFVEVMTRHLHRHRDGINAAINSAEGDLRGQLVGIAAWLLSQPPMDLIRMANVDLPAMKDREAARKIEYLAYETMLLPFVHVLEQAQARGEVHHTDLGNIAGAIMTSVGGLHNVPSEHVRTSRVAMAEQVIDVFIRGLAP